MLVSYLFYKNFTYYYINLLRFKNTNAFIRTLYHEANGR